MFHLDGKGHAWFIEHCDSYNDSTHFSSQMLESRQPTSGSTPSPWRVTSSSACGRRWGRLPRWSSSTCLTQQIQSDDPLVQTQPSWILQVKWLLWKLRKLSRYLILRWRARWKPTQWQMMSFSGSGYQRTWLHLLPRHPCIIGQWRVTANLQKYLTDTQVYQDVR